MVATFMSQFCDTMNGSVGQVCTYRLTVVIQNIVQHMYHSFEGQLGPAYSA